MVEAVASNVGIIILSPPSDTPMADRVATIAAAVGPKKNVMVAESYGGNDEPVDTLNSAIRVRPARQPLIMRTIFPVTHLKLMAICTCCSRLSGNQKWINGWWGSRKLGQELCTLVCDNVAVQNEYSWTCQMRNKWGNQQQDVISLGTIIKWVRWFNRVWQ